MRGTCSATTAADELVELARDGRRRTASVANTQELGITVVARESRGDRVERGYYRE